MKSNTRRDVLLFGSILLIALVVLVALEFLTGHPAVQVFYRHCNPNRAPVVEYYRGCWGGFELTRVLMDTDYDCRYDTVAYAEDQSVRCETLPNSGGQGIPISFAAAGFSEDLYREQERRSTPAARVVTASVARIYGDPNVIRALAVAIETSESDTRLLAGSIVSGAWEHVRR